MLLEKFQKTLLNIGNENLTHPIFYNSPIGIRFEIGTENVPIYIRPKKLRRYKTNSKYIKIALKRVSQIYFYMKNKPNILRIDGYIDEGNENKVINDICKYSGMPLPHEKVLEEVEEDGEKYNQIQLYWDLTKIDFDAKKLLKEIVKSDIGGYSDFVSSVYFVNTDDNILFHLYDDRGLDIVCDKKETLMPFYNKFNSWILKYDYEKISNIFEN